MRRRDEDFIFFFLAVVIFAVLVACPRRAFAQPVEIDIGGSGSWTPPDTGSKKVEGKVKVNRGGGGHWTPPKKKGCPEGEILMPDDTEEGGAICKPLNDILKEFKKDIEKPLKKKAEEEAEEKTASTYMWRFVLLSALSGLCLVVTIVLLVLFFKQRRQMTTKTAAAEQKAEAAEQKAAAAEQKAEEAWLRAEAAGDLAKQAEVRLDFTGLYSFRYLEEKGFPKPGTKLPPE